MTNLNMVRDQNGYVTFGLFPSQNKYKVTLSASAEQHFTVPNSSTAPNQWLAIFSVSPGGSIWVAFNETATLPSGTLSTSNSSQNPTPRQVNAGDIISLISSDTTVDVGVELYAIA